MYLNNTVVYLLCHKDSGQSTFIWYRERLHFTVVTPHLHVDGDGTS